MTEIARGCLTFRGEPVNCRRHDEVAGRWASYWHLVQEGKVEEDRLPDLRRCERLRWVPWVIQNAVQHPEIQEWQNVRKTEVNMLLWYREEYLVILGRRNDYWLLRSAYCTEQSVTARLGPPAGLIGDGVRQVHNDVVCDVSYAGAGDAWRCAWSGAAASVAG